MGDPVAPRIQRVRSSLRSSLRSRISPRPHDGQPDTTGGRKGVRRTASSISRRNSGSVAPVVTTDPLTTLPRRLTRKVVSTSPVTPPCGIGRDGRPRGAARGRSAVFVDVRTLSATAAHRTALFSPAAAAAGAPATTLRAEACDAHALVSPTAITQSARSTSRTSRESRRQESRDGRGVTVTGWASATQRLPVLRKHCS